jgi:polar amino acid transport system substrate-binding protein
LARAQYDSIFAGKAFREKAMLRMISAVVLATSIFAFAPAKAQQVLKVGVDQDSTPFSQVDPTTKALSGATPEIVMAVGKDAGFDVQINPMSYGDLDESVSSNYVDAVAANLIATAGWQKVADFSKPFYQTRDAIIIRVADPRVYKTDADFQGMVLAMIKESPYTATLKKAKINYKRVEGDSKLASTIEEYNAAGAIGGRDELAALLKNNAHPKLKIIDDYPSFGTLQGVFAVRKGNSALLSKLNASLAKLQANGTIKQILAKWGVNPA